MPSLAPGNEMVVPHPSRGINNDPIPPEQPETSATQEYFSSHEFSDRK